MRLSGGREFWWRVRLAHPKRQYRALSSATAAIVEALDRRMLLTTITVTGIGDTINEDGIVTLREAITAANTNFPSGDAPGGQGGAVVDQIKFNIPGAGVHKISVDSSLPEVTGQTTIDATTQPGFAGLPLIQLDGVNSGFAYGLTLTGGNSTVRGLSITGFRLSAIQLDAGDGDVIEGNFIGVDPTGAHAAPNSGGLLIYSGNNRIGGTTAASRNIISGNSGDGIDLVSVDSVNNLIQGNYIGTDRTGMVKLANAGDGIFVVSDASNTTIGGIDPGAGNIVSGNEFSGIDLQGDGNVVMGNYVGVAADGIHSIGNSSSGVLILSPDNIVGGADPAARNVIAGNGTPLLFPNLSYGVGVLLLGTFATNNVVQGNYIGTNAAGTAALPNLLAGVGIGDASDNTIGGTTSGTGNLISGNLDGILISGGDAFFNVIQGNRIGTNAAGTAAIPNSLAGIEVGGPGNTIGGAEPGAGNLISGNLGFGIDIDTPDSPLNLVAGNYIGTDITGTLPLGNGLAGVMISAGDGSLIGQFSLFNLGAPNIIAFNNGPGVAIAGGTGNTVLSNSIHDNALLGIDLNNDGPTPNDAQDVDTGPNDLQNFPMITSATTGPAGTKIIGTVSGPPNTQFLVQFFLNPAPDPTGFGQGQTLVTTIIIGTNASGVGSFNYNSLTPITPGQYLSATATNAFGNPNTSEFSPAVRISGPLVTASNPVFVYAIAPNQIQLQFSADVGPSLSGDDLLIQPLPAGGGTFTPASAQFNGPNQTATFTFANVLPDGNYRATLPAASVHDVYGDPLVGDYTFDYFVLTGDANHDRYVNTADFTILAANFGQDGKSYGEGDFNHDGVVNSLDFNALASKYGTYLAPPAGEAIGGQPSNTPPALGPAASPGDLFSDQPIDPNDGQPIDLLTDSPP